MWAMLFVRGDHDLVVPIERGKQLFELAKEPKTFHEVKSGGHSNFLAWQNGAYRKHMLKWLYGVM